MTDCFGIDLGTTNSVIAHVVDGCSIPIPIDGSPIIPSVVLFERDRTVVGREARNLELQYPERTIRSVKRKMGQSHSYEIDDRHVLPEEVSAEVLRALKHGAEQATGRIVNDVVITVPAYFDDAQRRATLRAGELAGMNVLRLLNEPTAASLIYDWVGEARASEQPEVVLIYDLGGGTFDVSVLEVFQGIREVRATAGNSALGGDDFDELLVRSFLDGLKRKHGVDPREDARAMARLRRVAEETKIRLSSATEVIVREEFLTERKGEPIHLEDKVTRRQLEQLIRPLLESSIDLCRRAIDDAHLAGQEVARICLVGGSTRIPLVRELLAEAFEVEIHEEIDPDLAVGLGASLQSGLLQGVSVERILVDVAAHTLGIRVVGREDVEADREPDTFAPVLRRNTVLPGVRAQEFYTMHDGQETIRVEVFQGEGARVSENRFVGSFEFPLRPAPEGTGIRVEFAYDLNGVVKVSIAQAGTDNEKSVAIAVADAGQSAQEIADEGEGGAAAATAIERKARRLLGELAERGEPRAARQLEELLERFTHAAGRAREQAEEAILDFFLDHEAGGADSDDEDEAV